MKLYISEGAVLLLAVLYLPLTLWFIWKLWKALPKNLALRVVASFIAVLIAAAIPLWDVVRTSTKMAELCPQAGLFVKRSVKVDGFYTNFGSQDMLKRGFQYIESKSHATRIFVYTKAGDIVNKEEFDANIYQVRSRYEFIYNAEHGAFEGRRDIGIQKSVVRDRETKEELGFALRYAVFPGWVDRNTIALLGRIGWACGQQDQDVMLMRQALLPK